MKLFYSPAACSLAVHILLRETGQPFELARVDTKAHRTADGADYYAINPKGYVPLLELDDGTRLTEGPVIAQYLCDRAGRPDLMPAAGTMQRYRVLEWQSYLTSEIHKSFTPLFNPAYDAAARAIVLGILRRKYEWLSAQLSEREYLTGTYTAADTYLFTLTRWAPGVKLDLGDLAPIQAYLARINARPEVREALAAEGLS